MVRHNTEAGWRERSVYSHTDSLLAVNRTAGRGGQGMALL